MGTLCFHGQGGGVNRSGPEGGRKKGIKKGKTILKKGGEEPPPLIGGGNLENKQNSKGRVIPEKRGKHFQGELILKGILSKVQERGGGL